MARMLYISSVNCLGRQTNNVAIAAEEGQKPTQHTAIFRRPVLAYVHISRGISRQADAAPKTQQYVGHRMFSDRVHRYRWPLPL